MLICLAVFVLYLLHPIVRAIKTSRIIQEHSVAYEQHPVKPTMRILIAGDSTGVGTGSSDPRYSIAGRIGSDFPQADIQNISENGLKLSELHEKLSKMGSQTYDLILFQIGANDVVGGTSLQKVKDELNTVLEYGEAHGDFVVVITAGNIGLSPVFKAPLSYLITLRTLKVREIFMQEISPRSSTKYVDLFKEREYDVFSSDIHKYYAEDLFHPSSDGYAVWYFDIKSAIQQRLKISSNLVQ